jgi:hypothetical protein
MRAPTKVWQAAVAIDKHLHPRRPGTSGELLIDTVEAWSWHTQPVRPPCAACARPAAITLAARSTDQHWQA